MDAVKKYMVAKKAMSADEREKAFDELATSFNAADEKTLAFRKACQAHGFDIVFRSGVSRQETLEILDSPETAKILAKL